MIIPASFSLDDFYYENIYKSMLPTLISGASCSGLEKIWGLYQKSVLGQWSTCQDNRCALDMLDTNVLSVSYQKYLNPAKCAIQMNSSLANAKVQLNVSEDAHSFDMQTPGGSLSGSTDFINFLQVEWNNTLNANMIGGLKIQRIGDRVQREGDRYRIELKNGGGSKEISFSADCVRGKNDVACDGESDYLLGRLMSNRMKAHLTRNIDSTTGIETIRLKLQSMPWGWLSFLLSPTDLGELEVCLDPKTKSANVKGNLQPFFVGELKLNETVWDGDMQIATSEEDGWGATEEKMNISFTCLPAEFSYRKITNKTVVDEDGPVNDLFSTEVKSTWTNDEEGTHIKTVEDEVKMHKSNVYEGKSHFQTEYHQTLKDNLFKANGTKIDLSDPDHPEKAVESNVVADFSLEEINTFQGGLKVGDIEGKIHLQTPKKIDKQLIETINQTISQGKVKFESRQDDSDGNKTTYIGKLSTDEEIGIEAKGNLTMPKVLSEAFDGTVEFIYGLMNPASPEIPKEMEEENLEDSNKYSNSTPVHAALGKFEPRFRGEIA